MRVEELVHELKEKITHLETELAEVKEQVVAMPKRVNGVFKPEDGQEYWCILASGVVHRLVWNDDMTDHDRYAIGNCFPTEQVAEDAVRVLKLIQKARESQNGFVPDWEDPKQRKYSLYYEGSGIWAGCNFSMNIATIFGFWEDESGCELFIHENREEILWFFTEYRL